MVSLSTQAFKSIFQHKLYPHMLKVTPELKWEIILMFTPKIGKNPTSI